MGWDDHYLDSELSNLPEEAHENPFYLEGPFEPNNQWLSRAGKEDQEIAVREWFLARFCDPAMGTPYNGREGGYLFIHGGPYDPANEISERFTGIVSDDLIELIVDEMHDMHGDQWAPINNERPDDYDESFDLHYISQKSEPLLNLRSRLSQYRQLLSLQQNADAKSLCRNLIYSAAVGALEAFLWETVYFWIDNDDTTLRCFITRIPVFRDEQIKLGDIFEREKSLKEHVKAYLQNLVWHRLDKVVPLFEKGLSIKLPSVAFFRDALQKRHHIVHRSGYDHEKKPVNVAENELNDLLNEILTFSEIVAKELDSKPIQSL